jgi:hypothetical protein
MVSWFTPKYLRLIPMIRLDLWLKDKQLDKWAWCDSYGLVFEISWLCFEYEHVWEWGIEGGQNYDDV